MEVIAPNMPKLLLRRIADQHFQAADKDNSNSIDEKEFIIVYTELLKEFPLAENI